MSDEIYDMTDEETAAHLRHWVETGPHGLFAWPTDACGYDQSIRFAAHRNAHWSGGTYAEFGQFILEYADSLDGGLLSPTTGEED